MQADTHAQLAFHLTGRRPAAQLDAVDGLGLKPALFAGYEDLGALRYDYPLVLDGPSLAPFGVATLSGLFDRALAQVAQGGDADRVRQHGLRVERKMRTLVSCAAMAPLRELFDAAARELARDGGIGFHDSCMRIRAALPAAGDLADCDARLPARLLRHLWEQAQQDKAAAFARRLQRLVLKLSAVIAADDERSPRGVAPARMAATMGPAFAAEFDFAMMSKLLAKTRSREGLPPARRKRIHALLRTLQSQRFYPYAGSGVQAYGYVFDSCAAAWKAWHDRQPKRIEVARALAVAELEVAGEYDAARHDAIFDGYGMHGLEPAEQAAFPDCLVCQHEDDFDADENARLMDILSGGLPIKVLLQTDDLTHGNGQAPGLRSRQLASVAMGLNTAYVLQASASHLYACRERLHAGLAYPGPALFNVYSGADARFAGVPPYLMAAAATESRAFPAFSFDPAAGTTWAARFRLEANPQPELDWPVQRFAYEGEDHQSAAQDVAFTVVDFLACDRRYASHLARVPRDKWNGGLAAIDASLAAGLHAVPEFVPSVLMVDSQHRLQKVIVDHALLEQASRCRDLWHSLQELGGIHNSHAEQLLAREQKTWEQRARSEAEAAAAAPAAAAATAAQPAAAPPQPAPAQAAPEASQRDPDAAYIETERCSSCNECTQLNNRLFAYNDDQQAYIADIDAGSYAQLVEAAENCQVAVIHPGKPRNPHEPGLEELLKRAAAFA